MDKGRLEAFSDGVIAVIITIMVLDLKPPELTNFGALGPLVPDFVSYVLSFVNVGIYWNNHHHLLHATGKIDGRVMWTNLFLLFWLSLIPFTTAWAGNTHFASIPTATYGFDLLMCGVAYVTLQSAILACNGPDSEIARAVGNDWKGRVSTLSYIVSLPLSFFFPIGSALIYVSVAALWFVPDRRIERMTIAKATEENAPESSIPSVPESAAPEKPDPPTARDETLPR